MNETAKQATCHFLVDVVAAVRQKYGEIEVRYLLYPPRSCHYCDGVRGTFSLVLVQRWCRQGPSENEVAVTDESKTRYAGAMDSNTRDGNNQEGAMKSGVTFLAVARGPQDPLAPFGHSACINARATFASSIAVTIGT